MQTENGQLFSNNSSDRSCQHAARKTFFVIFLLILLGAFVAPNAMACHKGKPHGPHTCPGDGGGDDGGSGGPVLGEPTVAGFIGPTGIQDDSARDCAPAGELLTTGGTYSCSTGAGAGGVHFSTFAMTLQSRKKDIDLCSSLGTAGPIDQIPAILPDSYSYGWTDNCAEDGACRIVINMSFSGDKISSATGGVSDAVDVQVSGTLQGDDLGGNPFDEWRELPISQISMQWFKAGSTAVKAACDWYPQSAEIPENPEVPGAPYVVFATEAVPPPPGPLP